MCVGLQPAHNALNDVKVDKPYAKLHQMAMMASRAYGETLTSLIQEKNLFLSPQYLTKEYRKKQRDTRQWDDLAWEYIDKLKNECHCIEIDNPQDFRLLVPPDIDLTFDVRGVTIIEPLIDVEKLGNFFLKHRK